MNTLSACSSSHLINKRRWRGQRFGPVTRRGEGAWTQCPVTDEQRSGRPKDRPRPVFSFPCILHYLCFFSRFNAAAGIYEMPSKSKGRMRLIYRPHPAMRIQRITSPRNAPSASRKTAPPSFYAVCVHSAFQNAGDCARPSTSLRDQFSFSIAAGPFPLARLFLA